MRITISHCCVAFCCLLMIMAHAAWAWDWPWASKRPEDLIVGTWVNRDTGELETYRADGTFTDIPISKQAWTGTYQFIDDTHMIIHIDGFLGALMAADKRADILEVEITDGTMRQKNDYINLNSVYSRR